MAIKKKASTPSKPKASAKKATVKKTTTAKPKAKNQASTAKKKTTIKKSDSYIRGQQAAKKDYDHVQKELKRFERIEKTDDHNLVRRDAGELKRFSYRNYTETLDKYNDSRLEKLKKSNSTDKVDYLRGYNSVYKPKRRGVIKTWGKKVS